MIAWYLASTKKGEEPRAQQHLEMQGFTTYLPYIYADTRIKNRETEVMFPGYIFLNLSDQEGDWGAIQYTRGVRGLVRFGGYPPIVPDDLIRAIQNRENSEGIHGEEITYQPGDWVRVKSGPFRFYEAVITKKSNERAHLLIDLMDKNFNIDIALENLEPA